MNQTVKKDKLSETLCMKRAKARIAARNKRQTNAADVRWKMKLGYVK